MVLNTLFSNTPETFFSLLFRIHFIRTKYWVFMLDFRVHRKRGDNMLKCRRLVLEGRVGADPDREQGI